MNKNSLKKLLLSPLCSEEIETSRKADEKARWLLIRNLQKMDDLLEVTLPLQD